MCPLGFCGNIALPRDTEIMHTSCSLRNARMSCLGLLMCAGLVAGCSSSAAAPAIPSAIVTGSVLLDGKPVIGAQVAFVPIENTKGFGGMAVTNEAGSFTIDKSGGPGATGLPEGKYRVTVTPIQLPEDPTLAAEFNVPPGAVTSLPKSYATPENTPLEAMVTPGVGPITLELTARGK